MPRHIFGPQRDTHALTEACSRREPTPADRFRPPHHLLISDRQDLLFSNAFRVGYDQAAAL